MFLVLWSLRTDGQASAMPGSGVYCSPGVVCQNVQTKLMVLDSEAILLVYFQGAGRVQISLAEEVSPGAWDMLAAIELSFANFPVQARNSQSPW